jgi:hypothetical protein
MNCVAIQRNGRWECGRCGFHHPRRFERYCRNLRPRTPEELEAVTPICAACRYHIGGMCAILIREGCGSCKSAADFTAKIESGMGCPHPDEPRFGPTSTIQEEATP